MILLTRTSCVCPGHQLLYECTIVGSAIQYTVWKGSALDCNSEVSLRHGQFIESGYANATCNGVDVFARVVNITDSCYISQLIVNTSLSMNGKSVECAFDNGAIEETVDLMIIRTTTGSMGYNIQTIHVAVHTIHVIIESFAPPNEVRLIHIQPGQLTFNWTSVDVMCDSVSYKIISSNCGRCSPVTINTTVTCTDVVASGQVCIFVIQTVVCGNLTGNMSHPIYVILKGS